MNHKETINLVSKMKGKNMQKGFQKVRIHSCGDGVIPTPVIGENGNWFIGNEDNEVKALGVDGKDGENGPEGSQGPKGDKGEAGPQGSKGNQGNAGLKGEKGDKGDTPELAVDLQTMETGKALDATMGKELNDKIFDINRNLSGITNPSGYKIYLFEANVTFAGGNAIFTHNLGLNDQYVFATNISFPSYYAHIVCSRRSDQNSVHLMAIGALTTTNWYTGDMKVRIMVVGK